MEAKFTKGEWLLTEDNFVDGCVLTSTERVGMSEICEISAAYLDGGSENSFEREQLANAHLIAAAPDMYKALEDIIDTGYLDYTSRYIPVFDLLKKARGE